MNYDFEENFAREKMQKKLEEKLLTLF